MKKGIHKAVSFVAVHSAVNSFAGALLRDKAFVPMYHSVTAGRGTYEKYYRHVSIHPDLFEKEIRFMKEHGHTFMHVSDIPDALATGVHKPTAIYFDDGFIDNLTVAAPILAKYGATGTVYLTTDFIDGKSIIPSIEYRRALDLSGVPESDWQKRIYELKTGSDADMRKAIHNAVAEKAGDGTRISPHAVFMNWDQVRELARAGWEIGSHTVSHKRLTECSDEELSFELAESKRRIEKEIGRTVTSLSFPHGRNDARVHTAVAAAGYKAAVSLGQGLNSRPGISWETVDGCTFLRNAAIKVDDSLTQFKARLYSGNLFK